jgi:hypothetical protein
MEEQEFTVLENKTIGRNMALYRKIRGMKAFEVAEGLGLKEVSVLLNKLIISQIISKFEGRY